VEDYIRRDVTALYIILIKFRKRVFEVIKVDSFKHSTISSLALAIIKCNYLKDYQLPKVTNKAYHIMRDAFFGGRAEIFRNPKPNFSGDLKLA
jgi:flagellar motor switch protein FliM